MDNLWSCNFIPSNPVLFAKIQCSHTMFDQIQSLSKIFLKILQVQRNQFLLIVSPWSHNNMFSCSTYPMLPFLDLSIVADHYGLANPSILWSECDFWARAKYFIVIGIPIYWSIIVKSVVGISKEPALLSIIIILSNMIHSGFFIIPLVPMMILIDHDLQSF